MAGTNVPPALCWHLKVSNAVHELRTITCKTTSSCRRPNQEPRPSLASFGLSGCSCVAAYLLLPPPLMMPYRFFTYLRLFLTPFSFATKAEPFHLFSLHDFVSAGMWPALSLLAGETLNTSQKLICSRCRVRHSCAVVCRLERRLFVRF